MRTSSLMVLAAFTATQASAITITESDFDGDFSVYDVYEFNINLGGGARFEGAFVGADLNGDGRIGSDSFIDETITFSDGAVITNPNEVPLLRGQYVGPEAELASRGSQDYFFNTPVHPLNSPFLQNWVSFHLDGDPGFGGPTILPFPETMTLRMGPEFGDFSDDTVYMMSVGEIPWQATPGAADVIFGETVPHLEVLPCDGVGECAVLREKTQELFIAGLGDAFVEIFEDVSSTSQTNQFVLSGDLGTPLGATEAAARLPDEFQTDGSFRFDIDFEELALQPNQIFFIDPDIAVGYTYEVTGALFTSVQAPSLEAVNDPDGYVLSFGDTTVNLAPGQVYLFDTAIAAFEISGISETLMLNPEDALAFVTGISLNDTTGEVSIFQTPTTVFVDPNGGPGEPSPVPLPASVVFLLAGVSGLFGLRRRKAT